MYLTEMIDISSEPCQRLLLTLINRNASHYLTEMIGVLSGLCQWLLYLQVEFCHDSCPWLWDIYVLVLSYSTQGFIFLCHPKGQTLNAPPWAMERCRERCILFCQEPVKLTNMVFLLLFIVQFASWELIQFEWNYLVIGVQGSRMVIL